MSIRFAPILALLALFVAAMTTNELVKPEPGSVGSTVTQPLTAEASGKTASPLTVSDVSTSTPIFNPSVEGLTITATTNQIASSQSPTIVKTSGGAVVRHLPAGAGSTTLAWLWDGADDAGKGVAPGDYRFEVQLTDARSKDVHAASQPFTVTDKRIVVSLSQQTLSAYNGDQLMLRSEVTTGGPELPTPAGLFHVMGKYSPLPVYSPWPQGSPYWFSDVTYQYAMEFYENSQFGLYIHDASWRSNYGPGSNSIDGTPGEDVTGTHGCINVPLADQEVLYKWASVGIPVVIKN
jgi:lipoprotein-anchoring transpeptidase ErfK/SrfK